VTVKAAIAAAVCYEIYGSRPYLEVARVNGLENFRNLVTGTRFCFRAAKITAHERPVTLLAPARQQLRVKSDGKAIDSNVRRCFRSTLDRGRQGAEARICPVRRQRRERDFDQQSVTFVPGRRSRSPRL